MAQAGTGFAGFAGVGGAKSKVGATWPERFVLMRGEQVVRGLRTIVPRHGTCSMLAVVTRMAVVFGMLVMLGGCSEPAAGVTDAAAGAAGAGPGLEKSVELGVPTGSSELDFAPLEDGAELRLQTFGQGGTHVLVGVRCTGFGNRAFVSATLRNLTTGVEVEEPAPARPQLLYCAEQGVCDLVPYLVHASGLTETDEEKHGLPIALTARVRDEQGSEVETTREAVLSTADL